MSQANGKPSGLAIAIVVIGSSLAGAGIFLAVAVVHRPASVAKASGSTSAEPALVVLSADTLATLTPSIAESAPPPPAATMTTTTTTPAPSPTKPPGATTPEWDPHSRFECWGTDNYTLDGVSANLVGWTVVEAKGHCKLHLSRCTLSGDVAVSASGEAEVTLDHCTLTGRRAIEALGSAHVIVRDTTTHGQVIKLGAATIDL